MKYDLIIDGVVIPNQVSSHNLDPQSLLTQVTRKDGVTYVSDGQDHSAQIDWSRVTVAEVRITER